MPQQKTTLAGLLLLLTLLTSNPVNVRAAKTVLFDESHGQLFQTGNKAELGLSGLAAVFEKEGWQVETSDAVITDKVLAGVDALVISGAFKPITAEETEAILRFLEQGGKLSVMLHIGSPFAGLLHAANVSISNGVLHEKEHIIGDNDLDFNILDLKEHGLTTGLEQFSVFGAWALLPTDDNAQAVAQTGGQAWIDLNGDQEADATQAFATVVAGTVGSGSFVVFSDDAIFQNAFLREYNQALGVNLARWLAE